MTSTPAKISHGFELEREQRIAELDSVARLYRHQRTGAELLSVVGNDENKVFGVTFRTPPEDSTGVAHILEHSVLCGSRKYPVKAPFLEMLKGSLKTFLNAMTYPDKTVYPVASVNLQDFYNLVDVYLDAVFHPRISPEILEQEGWHYELESPDAPLIYKGVVFNEMKGSYSSPDDRVYRLAQQALFPDVTYGVDSGGDPREIPNLTYEKFKGFYDRYYHPSNARIFFYGDDDPERRLELLDKVLSEFSPLEVDSEVSLQPRFNAPRKVEFKLPAAAASETRQGRVSVGWMLDETADVEKTLALGILSQILVGTPAAPLRKALIDSRLGDDVMTMGLSNGLRQMKFGAGLKGIDPADADKVESLILDTLGGLAEKRIDPETIEAAVNTIEFRLRENNTGSFPRGISVMLRAMQNWLYQRDPLAPLAWQGPLDRIKARLTQGEPVFEDLIRTQLIDNPHRVTALFTPDPELAASEAKEEREKLDAIRAAMSEDEVQKVIERTRALKQAQNTPDSAEALATLPMLTLKDLPARNTLIPIEVETMGPARLVTHDLPTNGILYADAVFDLRRLPPDLVPYVSIFARALLETGTASEDFVSLSQRIGRLTGGVRANSWLATIPGEEERGAVWLFLSGKAMPERAGDLFAIFRDVLLTARLNNRERIEQLIDEERASLEARLVPAGSFFAGQRLRGSLTEAGWAAEQMNGVSQLLFLRKLAADMKSGATDPSAMLIRLRDELVRQDAAICNLTADAPILSRIRPEVDSFVAALPPSGGTQRPDWPRPQLPRFEGLTIPAKVNYVVKGEKLPQLGYKPGGAAQVASNWLRGTWLWEKVRVQGGAYGAFTTLDRRSGALTFASYRDPNLLDTIAIFDGSAAFLRKAAGNATELERSIIGTIGEIDTYRLPDAKGVVSLQRYLCGETDEDLQTLRDEVLSASAADMRAFADALDTLATHSRTVVLGSAEAITAANETLEDRFTLTKIQ